MESHAKQETNTSQQSSVVDKEMDSETYTPSMKAALKIENTSDATVSFEGKRRRGRSSGSKKSPRTATDHKKLQNIKITIPKKRPETPLIEYQICPVCSESVAGSLDALNDHLDSCLEPEVNTEDESQFFAEEQRILSSLQKSSKLPDLNIDEDESNQYGPSQFSETDMPKPSSKNMTDEVDPTSFPDVPTDLNIIIACLKDKIRQQEAPISQSGNKCLICMDPYVAPATSIICWHVYCSECWLRTLSMKKVCPQCNMITSPSDLRRIYL